MGQEEFETGIEAFKDSMDDGYNAETEMEQLEIMQKIVLKLLDYLYSKTFHKKVILEMQ